MFGYKREEALGAPVKRFLHPVTDLRHNWVYQTMESHEATLTRRDGSSFPARVEVRELVSEGQATGLVYLIRDIADEKMTEEALRKTEKMAAAGRMAAAIAHEINNPLEAVINLMFLMRGEPMSREATRYLSMAEAEIERVSRIARQTLAFYRDTGKPGRVDVRELLNMTMDVHAFRHGHVQVHRRYRTDQAVAGFPGELQQVFHNLIGNAVEAGARDVWLRVDRGKDHGGRSGVRVTIADNGSGIDETVRGRIFHPFFTTKGDAGTGLGLWVSRGVILRHEGSIQVRTSTRDACKGTCFQIFLPR
jgi:signal transduction histidine kinase